MASSQETILVNVNIEISVEALEAIVTNTKKTAAHQAAGAHKVDTADKVSEMVSKFLQQKNFIEFVKAPERYMSQK